MNTKQQDIYWLEELNRIITQELPSLLDDPTQWDSLIVNRRKPHTYRAFHLFETGARVCLHRFETCSSAEAFEHPHPWAGAFTVLEGEYIMTVGKSFDRYMPSEHALVTKLTAGSTYAISDPLTWHSVQPLTTCYSIMVNGKPFEEPHQQAPTTKGKDLDKFTPEDLAAHLTKFKELLS